MSEYAIGLDLGTSSVRACIVRCKDGGQVGFGTSAYPSGDGGILTQEGRPLMARQNPEDYVRSIIASIRIAVAVALRGSTFNPRNVIGIGVAATSSTIVPVTVKLDFLSSSTSFRTELDAMAWLWKDHEAHLEALELTEIFKKADPIRIASVGNCYSSEWYWAKLAHCARSAPAVFNAAAGWVELSDLIPAWLCQIEDLSKLPRNSAAAGHKALYSTYHGGWPDEALLQQVDFRLHVPKGYVVEGAQCVGQLSPQRARLLGLPAGIPVSAGGIDAHLAAVGSGVRPGRLVKIMGTSGCDITVGSKGSQLPLIPGISGVVQGSVLPGHPGLEAGQPAVGDLYAWAASLGDGHDSLERAAASLKPGASALVALDWNNGNRSLLGDPLLTGLLVGQTLRTTPADIYRAVIEGTAFGAAAIIEQLQTHAVPVEDVIMCGGIVQRNALVPQIFADVLGRPVMIAGSRHTTALGAAIFAATAGSAFANVVEAQNSMVPPERIVYLPDHAYAATYRELGDIYSALHQAFGEPGGALFGLMRRLRACRAP